MFLVKAVVKESVSFFFGLNTTTIGKNTQKNHTWFGIKISKIIKQEK